jgi:hypothetical protein
MTISRQILLRMRNVLDKRCRENQYTHFTFSNFFFFSENRTVYEGMSKKKVVETEGPQMTSQYGAYALRAEKARLHSRIRMHTHTHTHIPISNIYRFSTVTVIPGRASVLRYTMYIVCLVTVRNVAANYLRFSLLSSQRK